MNSVQDVWNAVYQKMSDAYTPTAANTWFAGAQPLAMNSKCFKLQVPSDFQKEIIINRFGDKLTAFLTELVGFSLEVVIYSEEEQEQRKRIAERIVDVDDITSHSLSQDDYTFENFIVGGSNKLAEAACRAVANHTEDSFNPLFIYGGSGLGKTHLLCAIRNSVRAKNPSMKVLYLKGDEFTNEMVEAISQGVAARKIFREKYRYLDMLLIDDIQFIGGKESTQEEFFHTFNNLYENHHQIVLTADRPPNEMLRLEDRLKTRFEWGLIADIQPPDFETRMAIIKNKSVSLGFDLPNDVCTFIAENVTSNVRLLEGTVKKIRAYHDLDNMELTVPNVSRAIKDMYNKEKAENLPTPNLIIGEVSRFYNIEESVIRGTLKNKNTAEARQVAMYLVRKLTNLSLPDIGKEFGRDHSTVIHSLKKVEQQLAAGTGTLADNIRDITANINSKL